MQQRRYVRSAGDRQIIHGSDSSMVVIRISRKNIPVHTLSQRHRHCEASGWQCILVVLYLMAVLGSLAPASALFGAPWPARGEHGPLSRDHATNLQAASDCGGGRWLPLTLRGGSDDVQLAVSAGFDTGGGAEGGSGAVGEEYSGEFGRGLFDDGDDMAKVHWHIIYACMRPRHFCPGAQTSDALSLSRMHLALFGRACSA